MIGLKYNHDTGCIEEFLYGPEVYTATSQICQLFKTHGTAIEIMKFCDMDDFSGWCMKEFGTLQLMFNKEVIEKLKKERKKKNEHI